MKYHYFVSYFSTSKKDKTKEISICKLARNCKIESWEDILELGKIIEQEANRKDVAILSFILLKKGKE